MEAWSADATDESLLLISWYVEPEQVVAEERVLSNDLVWCDDGDDIEDVADWFLSIGVRYADVEVDETGFLVVEESISGNFGVCSVIGEEGSEWRVTCGSNFRLLFLSDSGVGEMMELMEILSVRSMPSWRVFSVFLLLVSFCFFISFFVVEWPKFNLLSVLSSLQLLSDTECSTVFVDDFSVPISFSCVFESIDFRLDLVRENFSKLVLELRSLTLDDFFRLAPMNSGSEILLCSRPGLDELVVGSTLVLLLSAEVCVLSILSEAIDADAVPTDSCSTGDSPNEWRWRLDSEDADDARLESDKVEELLESDDEEDLHSESRDDVEEEREEREEDILDRLLMVKNMTV